MTGRVLLLLAALCMGLMTFAAHAAELRAFTPKSYAEVLDAHRGRPFLLVFWSLECPPCLHELKLLGQLHAGRRFPAVIVSTDPVAEAERITQTLTDFGLDGADLRVFDGTEAALRFSIDPAWYGELPRSYFFDAGHQRKAVTGLLDAPRVEAWLAKWTK